MFSFHLLQHENPDGSLGSKEEGVHHHDRTNGDTVVQSSQAHDPAAEGKRHVRQIRGKEVLTEMFL